MVSSITVESSGGGRSVDPASVSLPPGPRLSPTFTVAQWIRDPVRFLRRCHDRYGDCFTCRFPGNRTEVFFAHPNAIKQIFTTAPEDADTGDTNFILTPLVGANSLLVLEGERHFHHRRWMMPPFHGERIYSYTRLISAAMADSLAAWPTGKAFAVRPYLQSITLDIIIQTVFGLSSGPVYKSLLKHLHLLLAKTANPIFLLLALQVGLRRLKPWSQAARVADEIDRLVYQEITDRRSAGATDRDDVVSTLIATKDENGRSMSDVELRDEIMTLLVAGHETIATALAWTLYHILSNPGVYQAVQDELDRTLAESPRASAPRLEYLDAVIKESLRLTPVIPMVGRRLYAPMKLGGWNLAAGTIVAPCIYLAHRHPEIWPEPDRFLPERFLGNTPDPYKFIPFGGGIRRCIGMAFALHEMRMILAEIISRTKLRLPTGYHARVIQRSITFAPSEGMPLIVEAKRDPIRVRRDVT
jgi:cytochrome P450